MKNFRDFMEDGMGSGGAGLQSSGGSPAIPTSTKGVSGAGDDSSTVPVSKKRQQQYTGAKFSRSEYKRTVPTVSLHSRAARVKEVKESQLNELGGDQHYSDTTGATSGGAKGTPITAKKMTKDAAATMRKITGGMNIGTQTAPAQTFMAKEESLKSQKEIVAANSKTVDNPTGFVKKKKVFSDIRSPIKD